eukprot:CAMPEP_0116122372 /NCGR_PEP_ID=MMETSP0329-20121206/4179_1 /TAXON_ID=697910 /ORGANISM="Pseudo-nitzschia arenysensis, Strain B593" /LENGTH=241 /DNA_ID=CAMNT_0003616215 /DNA_START=134 /DNA_END=855 /DNA_ORIENTATION=-
MEKQKLYLLPGEDEPERKCQNKSQMTKVMFMAAVARPQRDTNANRWFDGLLGIWGFVEAIPAKKSSKYRPRGTVETKIVKVDSKQHAKMMIENVIPAIKERFPRKSKNKPIYIQMDNAAPHSNKTDDLVNAACKSDGWDIRLKRQPAKSPDLNILDLGFFTAIQSVQQKKMMTDIDELIEAVNEAYWEQEKETVDNVFLSLQQSMIGVLETNGNNTKSVRHMKKAKLRREGKLPETLKCPA